MAQMLGGPYIARESFNYISKQQWSDTIILLELHFSVLEESSLVMKIRQSSEYSLFYVI
jgi:hypothetical protein